MVNEETPKANESPEREVQEGTEENTRKWLADVERAEQAAKELNAAADRLETLQAYARLGGQTAAGSGEAAKEEISDEEYAKKVLANQL